MEPILDTSWFKECQRLHTADDVYSRESMEEINIHFIYTNHENEIDKVITEKHDCLRENTKEDLTSYIPRDLLLKLIQNKKIAYSPKRYKLVDVLLYNIELEPKDLPTEEIKKPNFKKLSLIDDVVIPPSIFIFHSLNALYIFFKEDNIFLSKKPPLKILEENVDMTKNIVQIQTNKTRRRLIKPERRQTKHISIKDHKS